MNVTPEMLQAVGSPVLAFPFAAIAGAVLPSIVGGIFGRKENKENRKAVVKQNAVTAADVRAMNELNRARQLRDRENERRYAAALTKDDRSYAARQTADERAYAARLTKDDRRYAEALTKNDRAYLARVSGQDRANYLADKASDMAAFKKDRDFMQARANKLAVARAESRGLDFQQLRDDAIAAGFNPLTALGFANSYSREVDYHEVGAPYQSTSVGPGSATAASQFAGGARAGSAVSAGGSVAAGAIPTAVAQPGTGYSSSPPPVFASSAFLADALQNGIQTFFNAQEEQDQVRYQNIANQVAASQIQREMARSTPRDFGFDLTKVRPYRPAVTVSDGSGAFDPLHGRSIEKQPVMDIPVTGKYELGGSTVRGLSQDVEWSELAQMGNELWLGANYLNKKQYEWFPALRRLKAKLPKDIKYDYPAYRMPGSSSVPKGTRSYVLTGRKPVQGINYRYPAYGL